MNIRMNKETFMIYEDIRRSGVTNMFDARKVIELSNYRLDEYTISYIMRNYEELAEMYL